MRSEQAEISWLEIKNCEQLSKICRKRPDWKLLDVLFHLASKLIQQTYYQIAGISFRIVERNVFCTFSIPSN